MKRGGSVYIITNKTRTTLYTGVTSNLAKRVKQHRDRIYPSSFTARYNCFHLVYFENFHSIREAIAREKQIKGGSRAKKIALIEAKNPEWRDLYEEEVSRW